MRPPSASDRLISIVIGEIRTRIHAHRLERNIADPSRLLFIEPAGSPTTAPTVDRLTRVIVGILREHATVGTAYLGWHTCACGAESCTADRVIGARGVTNTLAGHYLAFHRAEIPPAEMHKVERVVAVWTARYPELAEVTPRAQELDPRRWQYANSTGDGGVFPYRRDGA